MTPVRFISRIPLSVSSRESFMAPLRAMETLFGENGASCCEGRLGLDVREQADRYIVEADLPGLSKEELDITVEDGQLTLAATRAAKANTEGETVRVRERWAGQVSRKIRLPDDVNVDKVAATLKDGVLTLTIEKSETAKPHKIEVTVD